jgi:hypothetical protein
MKYARLPHEAAMSILLETIFEKELMKTMETAINGEP